MSIPTNNLYDFVHQVLESKFLLRYFYPWGEKQLENLIEHTDNGFNIDFAENLITTI